MSDEEKQTISFQIPKEDFEILKKYAKQEKKVTVSWMLRFLVSDFIGKLKSKK